MRLRLRLRLRWRDPDRGPNPDPIRPSSAGDERPFDHLDVHGGHRLGLRSLIVHAQPPPLTSKTRPRLRVRARMRVGVRVMVRVRGRLAAEAHWLGCHLRRQLRA